MKRIELLALVLLACALSASTANARSYAPPKNLIPVQPQFVQAPWVYKWATTYTYKLKLPSTHSHTLYGHVEFSSWADAGNKGGGGASASRGFTLAPNATKIITIRFLTPPTQNPDLSYVWCVQANVFVEGASMQSVTTCSSYDTGK